MEKKFKNKVAFTGPTPLRKAMVEELLKIGYKWVAADKDDYEKYKYTRNFFVSIREEIGLGNTIEPCASYLTFTLPEQWGECLKACSEVEEEEKSKLNSLPEEYIVACNSGQECTEVINKFYSVNYNSFSNWKYVICSSKIRVGGSKFSYSGIYSGNDAVEDYIRPEFYSLPVLTFREWKNLKEKEFVLPKKWYLKVTNKNLSTLNSWLGNHSYCLGNYSCVHYDKKACDTRNISKDYTEITFEQFKKYVLKENNMEIEAFSIGGSLPLRKAFVEEGGFKVYNANTLSTEWNFLLGVVHTKDKLEGTNIKYKKHFELPKDWDAALEYTKLYFNQKEVKVFDLGNGYKTEVNLQGNTIKVESEGTIKASNFVAWFDNNFSTGPIITDLSGYKCKLFLSVGCLEKVDLDIVESIYNYIISNA